MFSGTCATMIVLELYNYLRNKFVSSFFFFFFFCCLQSDFCFVYPKRYMYSCLFPNSQGRNIRNRHWTKGSPRSSASIFTTILLHPIWKRSIKCISSRTETRFNVLYSIQLNVGEMTVASIPIINRKVENDDMNDSTHR